MYLYREDIRIICVIICSILAMTIIGMFFLGDIAFSISLILILALNFIFQYECYRGIQKNVEFENSTLFRQVEALFSIFSILKIRHPLPNMRNWSVSPDFSKLLISLIIEEKPMKIVDLGGGTSTIICGYCLESIGDGVVFGIDNKKAYSEILQKNIIKHGLENFSESIHAPLKPLFIGGKTVIWYDAEYISKIYPIDILIIDGPPSTLQEFSRYPALPVLFKNLSDDAVVIVDDGCRTDEKKMIDMWLSEFSCLTCEYVDTEKGTFILRKVLK